MPPKTLWALSNFCPQAKKKARSMSLSSGPTASNRHCFPGAGAQPARISWPQTCQAAAVGTSCCKEILYENGNFSAAFCSRKILIIYCIILLYIHLCKQAFAPHVSTCTYSAKITTKDCAKQKRSARPSLYGVGRNMTGTKMYKGQALNTIEWPWGRGKCPFLLHLWKYGTVIPSVPIKMATSIAMVPESPGRWFKIHYAWSSWLAALRATAVNWSIRGLGNLSRPKERMCVCVLYTLKRMLIFLYT